MHIDAKNQRKKSMISSKIRSALCVGAFSVLSWGSAQADVVRFSMTVDNSYALFTGDLNGATTFIGSDADWPTVETYNFNLATSAYLYVVTASDKTVAQGFLGQYENLTTGYKFYSQDPQWQVMATGLGNAAPYSGSASNLGLLSQEIQDANGGGNLSNGWTSFTAGGTNGSGPWGTMAGIDTAAKWVWYGGGDCNMGNPTLGGCDAGEWLVFRIAVAATPENPNPGGNPVPEPTSLALLALGLLGLGASRQKKKAKSLT